MRLTIGRPRIVVVAIAAVAAITAAAFGATLAEATAPAANGRIVFVRHQLGHEGQWTELFTVGANGTSARKVTRTPSGYRDGLPDWAPGGSRIVFQRCAPNGGTCLIWSVRPDGSGLKRLSPPCRMGSAPSVCPDDSAPVYAPAGDRIAFVRTTGVPAGSGTGPAAVVVADSRLRRPRTVVGRAFGGRPYRVAWSPNGRQLAFAAVNDLGANAQPRGGRGLFVVDVDGTGLRRVTPWALRAGDRPDWSPDGSRIVFRSQSDRLGGIGADLYTVRPDGSDLRRLTRVKPGNRVFPGSYSPDGRWVVLATSNDATDPTGTLPDLFVVRTDGTGATRVMRSPTLEESPDWGPRR